MINYETHLGEVCISQRYFEKLIGSAVSSCYGVSSMVPKGVQWWRSKLFKRSFDDTGIRVRGNSRSIVVDLHITVTYGLNIGAISKSIMNKVSYIVEDATGIRVDKVIVHVDRMNEE